MEQRKDNLVKIKTCMVTQYFEYYDVEEIAVIESRCRNLTNIKSYAIAIHDRDLLDSWEPKKRHFHIVLTFKDTTTIGAVANGLHVECQYVEKIKTTTKSAMLYLVHRNDPDKFQYKPEDVVASFDYVEYVDGCKPKVQRDTVAERIANWEIKQYNIYDYISVDEFATNKPYYDKCFIYRQNKLKKMDRTLQCVFITGASHTGKTTFAKQIANWKWFHSYVSSWGKHPLDNYEGQECIILDDLRDNTYELSDFLKLTDNNTDSLVWCRFYNKSIAECKLLIVTSIQDIHDFYKYDTDEKESQVQLFRRFKTYLVMDQDKITYYDFKEAFNDYVKCYEVKNPITLMFNDEAQRDFFSDIRDTLGLKTYEPPKEGPDSD